MEQRTTGGLQAPGALGRALAKLATFVDGLPPDEQAVIVLLFGQDEREHPGTDDAEGYSAALFADVAGTLPWARRTNIDAAFTRRLRFAPR